VASTAAAMVASRSGAGVLVSDFAVTGVSTVAPSVHAPTSSNVTITAIKSQLTRKCIYESIVALPENTRFTNAF